MVKAFDVADGVEQRSRQPLQLLQPTSNCGECRRFEVGQCPQLHPIYTQLDGSWLLLGRLIREHPLNLLKTSVQFGTEGGNLWQQSLQIQ